MAPSFSLTALGFALLSIFQTSNSVVITRTVLNSACPATTSATLPACGWISTNGSTRPYCFSTPDPTPSGASSTILPPGYSNPPAITSSRSVISVTVTPLPSSSVRASSASNSATIVSSTVLPPIYPPLPSSTSTSNSSSSTTLATVVLPPGYESPATTTSSALLPPGYQNPSATTSSQSTLPTEVGYCFRDGALLNVNVNVTITDNLGALYVLLCTSTSLGVSVRGGIPLGAAPAPNSVDDCFPICDANPDCTGFTFQSIAPYGVGPGTCSFYQGVGLFFDAVAEANLIAFIKVPLLGQRSIDEGIGRRLRKNFGE
ncbi:hypothetical protein CKM354_001230800 [Cercospora kikuchii]|uniref:Apple domain-containing protein n=1 Tax=Cercospora kikuchii TaxID=84275 RepID=A0A9P3FLR4_9PEZI|nr:uncharacterized protein CKM354_001230800 [Cercospora kikuchii]GIZ49276.1 hypothetical protein CKM354_001230800 [Cercospora kikuchii]